VLLAVDDVQWLDASSREVIGFGARRVKGRFGVLVTERTESGGGQAARLDRPWMLAVGARCRAMVLAARGELPEAEAAARRAMTEHERLPMPFERARTQLLLSQILRRRKRKQAAVTVLGEALSEFDRIGASLRAARARDDLDRNREIAAEPFVSVKTIETNLTSVYRKLGIRSRSQLYPRLHESWG